MRLIRQLIREKRALRISRLSAMLGIVLRIYDQLAMKIDDLERRSDAAWNRYLEVA